MKQTRDARHLPGVASPLCAIDGEPSGDPYMPSRPMPLVNAPLPLMPVDACRPPPQPPPVDVAPASSDAVHTDNSIRIGDCGLGVWLCVRV